MRSEPVAKSACEYPGAAGAHRIKRENLSERSEFIFPPDLRLPTPGTPRSGATNQFCWSSAPTLSLLTFLGEARKVSGCRLLKQCFSPPAYPGRPKKERHQLRNATHVGTTASAERNASVPYNNAPNST